MENKRVAWRESFKNNRKLFLTIVLLLTCLGLFGWLGLISLARIHKDDSGRFEFTMPGVWQASKKWDLCFKDGRLNALTEYHPLMHELPQVTVLSDDNLPKTLPSWAQTFKNQLTYYHEKFGCRIKMQPYESLDLKSALTTPCVFYYDQSKNIIVGIAEDVQIFKEPVARIHFSYLGKSGLADMDVAVPKNEVSKYSSLYYSIGKSFHFTETKTQSDYCIYHHTKFR